MTKKKIINNTLSYTSLKQKSSKIDCLALLMGADTFYLSMKKGETKKSIAIKLRNLADQLENN